jgi:hypothetical protein
MVARPQFAGSGEPATSNNTFLYFSFSLLAQQHVFSLLMKTRQINVPN